jgi:hypothetical protein
MKPIGLACPGCEKPLPESAFYDDAEDGLSGRYKCPYCSRDTVWKQVVGTSFDSFIERITAKVAAIINDKNV